MKASSYRRRATTHLLPITGHFLSGGAGEACKSAGGMTNKNVTPSCTGANHPVLKLTRALKLVLASDAWRSFPVWSGRNFTVFVVFT
jgi:hypothetical protein